jgi:hypothetical protein
MRMTQSQGSLGPKVFLKGSPAGLKAMEEARVGLRVLIKGSTGLGGNLLVVEPTIPKGHRADLRAKWMTQ